MINKPGTLGYELRMLDFFRLIDIADNYQDCQH
jgi:hypothetical protein